MTNPVLENTKKEIKLIEESFNFLPFHKLEQPKGKYYTQEYSLDQYVHWESDRIESAYFVVEGLLLQKQGTVNGKEKILGLYGPGTFLHPHQYMEKWTEDLTAASELKILAYPFKDNAFETSVVLHSLAQQNTILRNFQSCMFTGKHKYELATLLLLLKKDFFSDGVILLRQESLAALINANREVVTKIIGQLRDLGLISNTPRCVEILNTQGLIDFALS